MVDLDLKNQQDEVTEVQHSTRLGHADVPFDIHSLQQQTLANAKDPRKRTTLLRQLWSGFTNSRSTVRLCIAVSSNHIVRDTKTHRVFLESFSEHLAQLVALKFERFGILPSFSRVEKLVLDA